MRKMLEHGLKAVVQDGKAISGDWVGGVAGLRACCRT